MVAWLARVFCIKTGRAQWLLDCLILIGVLYATYGFVLVLLKQSQFQLFYGMSAVRGARDLSGPFVNHNSFATYSGLIALCAAGRLVSGGWREIGHLHRIGKIATATIQYLMGRGALWLAATILTLSAVIATGSRGGNFATLCALATMLGAGMMLAGREAPIRLAVIAGLIASAGIALLFAMNGAYLASHLDDMAAVGLNQNMRFLFWDAALRMVADAPLRGLGLGTYQTMYPSYSTALVPFVVDKAHNDYLELAAGWGLPAALLWWSALLWLMVICARGIFTRRRNQLYPLVALGAGILVGVHANFDFSLQMPAVAATFAAILGLGLAQAFRTGRTRGWPDSDQEPGP
jgi:O-antigen ligase